MREPRKNNRAIAFFGWLQRTYGTEVRDSLRDIAVLHQTISYVCVRNYINVLLEMGYMEIVGIDRKVKIYHLIGNPK